jgi:hypothetical protein
MGAPAPSISASKFVGVLSTVPPTPPPLVTAVEHIRRMRGGSQPHLMRCSDGHFYVVKFRNNPQGPRILINEYFAGKLARLLGLPCPDICLVDVQQDLVRRTPELSFELPRPPIPVAIGLAFGSEYPSRGRGAHRTLQSVLELHAASAPVKVENLSDLFGILMFDKWTSNTDHRQILCLERPTELGKTLQMFIIDNGFCFGGPTWRFTDLPRHGLYLDRSIYSTFHSFQTLEPWLERLDARVTLEELARITEQIPDSWIKDYRNDLLKMVKTLYERKKNVSALVRLSLNVVHRSINGAWSDRGR